MSSQSRPAKFAVPGHERLNSQGFVCLWLTQWLTAINDNAFRWLVVGIGKDLVSPADHPLVLTIGLASFVLPYLLLSSHAGYLADRFGKRDVVLAGKIVEWMVLALGMLAIHWGNLPLLFVVVGLMGCQSALFAPAKMGLLPEMMSAERIAPANGWFGLSTVTATMIGMGLGGFLADVTSPHGSRNLGAPIVVLMGSATIGIFTAILIPRYAPANPQKRFPWRAHIETWRDLRTLAARGPLFLVAMGIVFFWSIAALAQLNIDQFAYEAGTFYESERTPLLLSMVLGVGIGSVAAGVLSRGRIEMGLLVPSLFALSFCAVGLVSFDRPFFNTTLPTFELFGRSWAWNPDLFQAMSLMMGMGIAAGIFDVPLAAYLQHRSPAAQRGAILSAANFCIFSGVLLTALLFLTLRTPFHAGARWRVFSELSKLEPMLQNEVDDEGRRFAESWKRNQRVTIESQLETTPHAAPLTHRYAALLWEEIGVRRELGERPMAIEYYDRFPQPEYRAISKQAFRERGKLPLLSSRHLFLLLGAITLPVALLTLRWLPQATLRFLLGGLLRASGCARLPSDLPLPDGQVVVLVVNRCGALGRLLLHVATGRPLTEVRWESVKKGSWEARWDRWWGVIRIAGGPAAMQEGMVKARRTVLHGGTLVVYPREPNGKARISETEFDGYPAETLRIVEGIKVPWVPVFIREPLKANNTRSSWSRLWAARRSPLAIRFGSARPLVTRDTATLRRWVHEVGSGVMSVNDDLNNENDPIMLPAAAFLRRCREAGKRRKIVDSTGTACTGQELLMRTLILRRLLRAHVLDDRDRFVALLLPPSVPGVIANMAVALDRRIAVNLNYTVSAETLNACLELCGIRKVITSRRVMEKLDLKLNAEMVLLEDLREKLSWKDKLAGYWNSNFRSPAALERSLGLDQVRPDDPLTVIFTSGSTGVPKGVVLTQNNIATNVRAIRDVVRLERSDVLIGVLPFFHSFGYSVTLWGAMNLELSAVYHFSPLDSKVVGKLAKEHGATVLLATPTFLRSYLKRCTPEEFSKLQIVVAGAEKLPVDLCDEFERKFGVRPVEGYGATELSPLVSVNVPASRDPKDGRVLSREGSVGLPIPGERVRIEDLETGATLGPNQPGMLWVSGPNVMQGYLHRKDLTDEVLVDGWYRTGDVAYLDDDGFIHITGRVSRFSKIGGEMVPHIQIEEELTRIIDEQLAREGRGDQAEGYTVAVSAVPDERKGERLIVLYVPLKISVDVMRQGLQAAGLPPLYLPGADSFFEVNSIPVLGSGKLDLKGLQKTALEKANAG